MKKPNGYMRQKAPICADWVDALRDVGLLDDEQLKNSLKAGEAYFQEGEHVVGDAAKHAERCKRERERVESMAKEAKTTRAQWAAIRRAKKNA